jgi:hypothetical protein
MALVGPFRLSGRIEKPDQDLIIPNNQVLDWISFLNTRHLQLGSCNSSLVTCNSKLGSCNLKLDTRYLQLHSLRTLTN